MGAKYKEHGGEGVQGLSSDFISGLQSLFNGGGLGTAGSPNAGGATSNIMGVLQDILNGGQGKAGSAISQLLSTQQTRDVNGLRSRFGAGGGTAFGTPGAYAESNYRAQAAPQITQAITGLQLQAMSPILQSLYGLTQKGTTQREGAMEKSGLAQGIGLVSQVGKAALPFVLPGAGAAIAAAPAFLSPGEQADQVNAAPQLSLQGYYQG